MSIPRTGPTWISHWPQRTSALVPEQVRPASKDLKSKASLYALPKLFSPPTEQYYCPCGRGYPWDGNPRGQGLLSDKLMIQYSCSIPNHGFSSTQASKILEANYLKLVLLGFVRAKSFYVSHKTIICGAPLNGSLKILTGLTNISELSPVACLVLEPS